jgi:hypothetical protein
MEYEIKLGGQTIGQARVSRQGLYYCLDCHCKLSGETMFRLVVSCDNNTEDLGLLIPERDRFVLRTRLPVKRLGEGQLRFEVRPKLPQKQETFIPLSPEEPFEYLQRLENAYLQIRDGQIGIAFRQ